MCLTARLQHTHNFCKKQECQLLKMQAMRSGLQVYPMRIKPGKELKTTLLTFARQNDLHAPFVLSCVGSVFKATIRMAKGESGEEIKTFDNFYEILSLSGTLAGDRGHLHITLGDSEGQVIGGHVVGDLMVYTTAEVVIGDCVDVVFTREEDDSTGFPELVVTEKY